ncbi:4-hydroxy-tetrahydrodipicolinate synthase [Microbacterium sp. AK009]|uniref:dihydrodipicolinate synthase family protein n=1 Tax=Microbacterium sp. AK009 TaxID=2723068 RepID=UPI001802EDE5|nr:dihydrodipicolinate synthase family protein [Microbacterium sp. AK009]NYF16543.1 4-hydroxy-tetrahydrodipicolinate synthase [Microbacterium sp. AK009]
MRKWDQEQRKDARRAPSNSNSGESMRRVSGVCPVVETPFTSAGHVDAAAMAGLIDHLGSIGTPSVMYAGFASEALKLTDDERDELTRLVIDRAKGHGMLVVASVSDHATHVAAQRAARYAEWGADLINVLPPYLLAPSAAATRTHVRTLLDAVAPTPAILQFAPAQTGTAMDAATIAELSSAAPNLVQVKVESAPPGRLIAALRDTAPDLDCLVGYAGLQLPDALRRGAVGVQPGCSFTELYLDLWLRWTEEDFDGLAAQHSRLLPYLSYWMQHVELVIAAEKRISYLRGLIPTDATRGPGWVLDREELEMIDRFVVVFEDDFARWERQTAVRS